MDCKQISSFLSLFYPDVCCSVVFYAMLLIPFPPYSVKMQGIKNEISILTHFLKNLSILSECGRRISLSISTFKNFFFKNNIETLRYLQTKRKYITSLQ